MYKHSRTELTLQQLKEKKKSHMKLLREITPSCMSASRFKYNNLTTALERILFSSVVMVFAFRPGIPGSNSARTLYFCHEFLYSCSLLRTV